MIFQNLNSKILESYYPYPDFSIAHIKIRILACAGCTGILIAYQTQPRTQS